MGAPVIRPLLRLALAGILLAAVAAAAVAGYVGLVVLPGLPALDTLTDYQPKIPLRVYTADRVLIREFGVEHRDFVALKDIPPLMQQALLATEDARFYQHGAVDWIGAARAGLGNLFTGSRAGASTITMQVAREFFLTKEKKVSRKINEIALAYRIEQKLPKPRILELYMNQIYLGEHAYGFASAAQAYFGKPLKELTIAETAMLAGLPQAPASRNPVVNPARAQQRQQHVLRRLRDTKAISDEQYRQALAEPLRLRKGRGPTREFATHAEYAAEIVRQVLYKQYKEEIYTKGFSVYTTLTKAEQDAAYEAVRAGVLEYDRRHGYRGPEGHIELPKDADERQDAIDEALQERPASDGLLPAVLLSATPRLVKAQLGSGQAIEIGGEGLRFAAAALPKLKPGALIRVSLDGHGQWSIGQLPEVAAAFVALDPADGAVRAWVGGFDFGLNQFDHVNQAWRQPGSSFKPFVYSAALEKGFAPSTVVNDAPLSISRAENGGGPAWEPKNDDGKFAGPITMRDALAHSNNVASVRILRAIGPDYVKKYVSRFGFDTARQPANLTLTLGTGAVTPQQMAGAYAVFANGGYQVAPYLIQRVIDAQGKVLFEAKPEGLQESARVIDPRNAFVMDAMLREVAQRGTGAQAGAQLGRADLAGKTGTTSDALDGWFAGYGGNRVAVSWMGYDDPRSLGSREFGATLALPAWIRYMRVALQGKPVLLRPVPDGIVEVEGDWMYNEFASGAAVKTLGFDAPPPEAVAEPEKRRILDIFGKE